ncbi:hypothetical protein [Microbacterium testaceum]|uniref:hypothetical protein n=1 Tax=Microbacterium testaceum TaxID=2033 RepID=UPI00165295DA|nr:hypothetical protein [Microbacterium testaceum]
MAASIAAIYAIGIAPRAFPVFGIDVSPATQLLILLGSATFSVSLLLAGRLAKPPRSDNLISSSRTPKLLLFLVAIGILGAVINYATGDIPILSGDVNGSRLNGNFGTLGRMWPIFLPLLQLGVIAGIVSVLRRNATRAVIVSASLSTALLLLNGGRSLLVICLLAGALVAIDLMRPKLWVLVSAAAGGAGLIGLIGFARTQGSAGADAALQYLDERNLDSWWGSLDLSLQTGPRVLDLANSAVTSREAAGSILFGDIANFFNSSFQRSDRLVTEAIGRDPLVLGGMPPTIWGGFTLEFGPVGLVLGAILVALALVYFNKKMRQNASILTDIWFGYFSAYILLGSYSYFSVRPSWITIGVALLICSISEKSHTAMNQRQRISYA